MRRRSLGTSMWLTLLAGGGLLAGHVASYFVVAPDAHERAELLAATGHSQHSGFGTWALAAMLAAVIGLVAQHLRSRRATGTRATSGAGVAALLIVVQVCGFVSLEAWERGHALAGVAELIHEPAFLIGLVAQVLVAAVATAIVLLVRATVDALLRLLASLVEASATRGFPAIPSHRSKGSVARAAWNLRGPPSPAASAS